MQCVAEFVAVRLFLTEKPRQAMWFGVSDGKSAYFRYHRDFDTLRSAVPACASAPEDLRVKS
jgi:hypothetical protein